MICDHVTVAGPLPLFSLLPIRPPVGHWPGRKGKEETGILERKTERDEKQTTCRDHHQPEGSPSSQTPATMAGPLPGRNRPGEPKRLKVVRHTRPNLHRLVLVDRHRCEERRQQGKGNKNRRPTTPGNMPLRTRARTNKKSTMRTGYTNNNTNPRRNRTRKGHNLRPLTRQSVTKLPWASLPLSRWPMCHHDAKLPCPRPRPSCEVPV